MIDDDFDEHLRKWLGSLAHAVPVRGLETPALRSRIVARRRVFRSLAVAIVSMVLLTSAVVGSVMVSGDVTGAPRLFDPGQHWPVRAWT